MQWGSVEGIIAALGGLVVALTGFVALFRRETRKQIAEATSEVTRSIRGNDPLWAFIDNLPLPCWQKDTSSRMLWINSQYVMQWNIPAHRYEGKMDRDVWPADVAQQFVEHDRRVIQERVVFETTEEVPDRAGDLSSPRRVWRIWKFPIFQNGDSGSDVIGVGGFAAPLSLTLAGYAETPMHGKHATKPKDIPVELQKWTWARLCKDDFRGFAEVMATMLGCGLVRDLPDFTPEG